MMENSRNDRQQVPFRPGGRLPGRAAHARRPGQGGRRPSASPPGSRMEEVEQQPDRLGLRTAAAARAGAAAAGGPPRPPPSRPRSTKNLSLLGHLMSRPLRVLLGVSGGIAAYKSAELVRRLRARGHEVRCALTRSAGSFVTPLTLEVLSGHAVYQEEYLSRLRHGGGGSHHGRGLGRGAVRGAGHRARARPPGAGPRRRLPDHHRAGLRRAPWWWRPPCTRSCGTKPALQEHMDTLRRRGVWIVGPVEGPLASGEMGMGRMADPEAIAAAVEGAAGAGPLAGRTVLVTAGPTYEPVDPVRFLGNRSSGQDGLRPRRRGGAARRAGGPRRRSGRASPPRPA